MAFEEFQGTKPVAPQHAFDEAARRVAPLEHERDAAFAHLVRERTHDLRHGAIARARELHRRERIVAMGIEAALHAPIPETRFGVFRM